MFYVQALKSLLNYCGYLFVNGMGPPSSGSILTFRVATITFATVAAAFHIHTTRELKLSLNLSIFCLKNITDILINRS